MTFNPNIVKQLREVETKEQIAEIFDKNNVTRTRHKQNYLHWAMYAPTTFYSSFTELNEENIYEITKEMFLAKKWKLHELYEKMNLLRADVLLTEVEKQRKEQLLNCNTIQEINDVFEKAGITSYIDRMSELRKYMEAGYVYETSQAPITKDDYDFECAVFLDKTWR